MYIHIYKYIHKYLSIQFIHSSMFFDLLPGPKSTSEKSYQHIELFLIDFKVQYYIKWVNHNLFNYTPPDKH
jgi:hypothetical protein